MSYRKRIPGESISDSEKKLNLNSEGFVEQFMRRPLFTRIASKVPFSHKHKICNTRVRSIKYLFKCVCPGFDRVTIDLQGVEKNRRF